MEKGHYRLDDPRYLTDERPKEIWRRLVSEARSRGFTRGTWCDVGCASGAFLRYVHSEFTIVDSVGVDPASSLLALAKTLGRGGERMHWIQDSLPDLAQVNGQQFDVVSCVGVLALLDDLEANLSALGDLVNADGLLFVLDLINPKPVDMIMRFRHADSTTWEMAYNTFSMQTYERVAQTMGMSVHFTPAHMPFAIPESEDPMRAWTTPVGNNPFQVVSGTGQLLMFTLATFQRLQVRT